MITFPQREKVCAWVDEARAAGARLAKIVAVLGLSLRTLQRWREDGALKADGRTSRQWTPPNKLSQTERERVLSVANSTEFAACTPSHIVPVLAERGEYVASESTFYRVLRQARQLAHRQRSQMPRKRRQPTPLKANAPGQVVSWDITWLPTTVKGQFLYLYLFMDVYSRKIVAWQVHEYESNELAAELIEELVRTERIGRDQMVLHADNGGPMTGATMLATLQTLGVMPSFSRPRVSNDNPYSESLFKTLKYHRLYPASPFAELGQARTWVAQFVSWYNHEHRHSAIRYVTPHERHSGAEHAILRRRHTTYIAARKRHPQRWSGQTRNWSPIQSVYLNPGKSTAAKRRDKTTAA